MASELTKLQTEPRSPHEDKDIFNDWLDQCFDGARRKSDITESMAPSCGSENETKGEHIQRCRTGTKPHSTPLTLKWLEENYEVAEGVCIPRNALYMHYLDYCSKNDTQPVNAASFGKIIRQQFSHITTRRLGTRGQSKYHYYGIGVKETSHYYDAMYSAKNVQGYGNGKRETSRQDVPYLQIMAFSPRSKLGTLLPDFPDIKDLKLPPNVPEDKVLTFLMMYRTHCQRILDTVIRANFDEIQSFLVHFWQGMPQHLLPLLNINAIVTLVGVCDSILYKAIASVLMPSVLQALPESLTQVIRKFARQLDDWLNYALYSLPENLCKVKFDLARRFCQLLRRQTSLNHLCQAARTVTQNREITSQMSEDWLNIDLNSIVKQTLYTMDHYSEKDHKTIANLCREFERLLEDQAPVECYLEWLDTMVDRCVVKPSKKQSGSLRTVARQFLLMWSCFGTRVIRDMTLQSSPSFGSFHLLHLMFDDYVLYLVENLHCQERASEFLRNIRQGDTSIVDFGEELMPSSLNFNDGLSSQSGNMTPPVGNSVQRPMERCSVITNGRDVMSQVGDYSCQRNVNEVSHVNQSHSPVHDNSQPVTIKSAYSPAADSSRSNSSNPSMQPSTQNTLPVTPVNHISSCSPTYQQCQSYHMAYGQTLTNQHPVNMDTQNSHSMYSYDVSSQYPRHYLSAAAASVAPPTEPIKTNVTSLTPTNRQNVLSSGAAAEWPADSTATGSNRYNTPVMTHESVLRKTLELHALFVSGKKEKKIQYFTVGLVFIYYPFKPPCAREDRLILIFNFGS
ncbi:transcription factor RFX4-like [Octopus vulgaris]|uniref:Transcription factor RFX4-like n=1 Tax=Octopus vulgaris TaxID=6645 RepID=A0AA36AWH0_OCTVU|nr:transcription factor RFX4-like [Octopus vulgaris]